MPMPWTYRHAAKEWARFLADVKDVMGTPSDNVAYTTAQGVFGAFRDRLRADQVAQFAQVLPAIPRALFIDGWVPQEPRAWADAATYLEEVKALRRHHNLSTDQALEAVSVALHRAVGGEALSAALDRIGPEARRFWHLEGYSADQLAPHGF